MKVSDDRYEVKAFLAFEILEMVAAPYELKSVLGTSKFLDYLEIMPGKIPGLLRKSRRAGAS